jgi:type I site-specific restriction endonuclease
MRVPKPLLIAACLAGTLPATGLVAAAQAAESRPADAAQLAQRIAILRRTGAELRAAASQAPPRGIDAAQLDEVRKYDAWLRASADRLDALAGEGDRLLKKAGGADAEAQMAFNLQYLQLQSQMQHENRSYTAISNIMKTKHDTVKNSISNVR